VENKSASFFATCKWQTQGSPLPNRRKSRFLKQKKLGYLEIKGKQD